MKSAIAFAIILGGGVAGIGVGAAIGFTFLSDNHELWQLLFLFWGLGAGLWIGQKMAIRFTRRRTS